ncbi:MAG: C45 family autoproteolytic acyltransferase/hydrolase [Schlesneria sp.]
MSQSFSRNHIWFMLAMSVVSNFCASSLWGQPPVGTEVQFEPDPAAVTRQGPGWRFPQDGWIVVHIEGTPYERGYQHGRLLAHEIVDFCHTIARLRSVHAPDKAWHDLRLFVNALFLRRFDNEYLREMQGIADGAAAAGAKFDGRLLDLIDIVVINADVEVSFLESALEGTANGIDRESFRGRHGSPPRAARHDRCSAFVATGAATADGKIVAGHITMSTIDNVRFYNVWLDVKPSVGNRMVFQTFPGGIQSGLDYYINDAGLIISETTIEQTKFNPQGEMLASRIRRAVQYADSIDKCAEILTSSNNGLYTNEWLFGDIKTNEIAMLELGTNTSKTWRSSRNEWVAGTTGFYWGCNNVKDVGVFKETVADFGAKPANLVLHPHLRDQAWIKLFNRRRGMINEAFGFEAFSTPPLVAFPSCDAKFTTAAMAKDLKTWALFGPPLGRTWMPSESDREDQPSAQPLVAHDWTLIDVQGVKLPSVSPDSKSSRRPIDLEMFPKKGDSLDVEFDANHPFAWRGTLLPKNDADIWLAAAFADFEKVVALEHAIAFHGESPTIPAKDKNEEEEEEEDEDEKTSHQSHSSKHDDPNHEGRDLIDLALFQHESKWLTAVRRVGGDIPLTKTQTDPADGDWYRIAAGKGVMLLAELRRQIGPEKFIKCLDEFGQAHAGQEVTTEQFRTHLKSFAGAEATAIFDRWQTEKMSDEFSLINPWTIFSHEVEPDRVLIVYGTIHDRAAQKEAAAHLQTEIMRRFANVLSPMKSDTEVTDEDLKTHYLLLVGHSLTNRISERFLEKSNKFPVKFGRQSFTVEGELYAHPETWVVAAGENPFNPRYSAVIFAGMNAASTWRCVRNLPDSKEPNPQVILNASGKRKRMFRVRDEKMGK